jgi:hypothetical protein
MSKQARITSTDVVRHLKIALGEFEDDARDGVTQLLLELRRALDWVEQDRARYWPREVQRASDAVVVARNDLERCEMALRSEDKRSCYEQKLALDRAKRRLRLAEEKVRAVRRWRVVLQRQADNFQGRLAKMTNYLDMDLPRAVAALDRMLTALDKYTERAAPSERPDAAELLPPESAGSEPQGADAPRNGSPS